MESPKATTKLDVSDSSNQNFELITFNFELFAIFLPTNPANNGLLLGKRGEDSKEGYCRKLYF